MGGGVTSELALWMDDEERDGFANMAVDEWLLETAEGPVMRVYRWEPGWGSFGYFVSEDEAAEVLGRCRRVRRWTGGGVVDHAADWTFTLAVPSRAWLAGMKGAASYRVIHAALAEVLSGFGVEAKLVGEALSARGGDCFVQAVEHDLVDPAGRKLAGGGQRRARHGLLHQGSVVLGDVDVDANQLAKALAERLAKRVERVSLVPPEDEVRRRVESRYADPAWAQRR